MQDLWVPPESITCMVTVKKAVSCTGLVSAKNGMELGSIDFFECMLGNNQFLCVLEKLTEDDERQVSILSHIFKPGFDNP